MLKTVETVFGGLRISGPRLKPWAMSSGILRLEVIGNGIK